MKLTTKIKEHMQYCKNHLLELQEKNPDPPKEKITCYTSGGRSYWRITDEHGNRRHLSVKEKKRAAKIAMAQVLSLEINDLACEIEACRRYLSYTEKHGGKLERFMSSAGDGIKSLIHESFLPEDERIREWAEQDYERSTMKPHQLRISTSQGFKVRSKSEALIAEVLFLLGLPCRYEEVIYLNGERFVPDFTVLNPITMKIFYIEYNGLMDDPEYVERFLYKSSVYIRNGIIPDIDMLQFFETDEAKIDMRQIRFRIENFVYGDAT